jgi:Protein of unknown function (DUF3788)
MSRGRARNDQGSNRPAGAPAPAREPAPAKVPFPKKSQPPTPDAFAALLPVPLGRKLDAVRGFLGKKKDVSEEVFFYGPNSGWGLRYRAGGRPLCTLLVHRARPIGILSLDPAASEAVHWRDLSDVAQKARRAAHGSPSLLWLDVPLDSSGASDFKVLLKAKLATLRAP